MVALLAEGVDRNEDGTGIILSRMESPSSRRAWIEILLLLVILYCVVSPSSRRAWIEIMSPLSLTGFELVALLAEGVDRNITTIGMSLLKAGRPPRGGRG